MTKGFAVELLDLVDRVAAISPLPAVTALHLPRDSVSGTRDGEFCAIELADGSIGLSYLLLGDTLQRVVAAQPGAGLAGMPAQSLAHWFLDDDPVRRTLGLAAVNAISQRFLKRAGYALDWTTDSIGLLDPGPGDRVGMVGLFRGLADRIVAAGATLTVLELVPELAGDRDGYRVTLDPAELAGCDKILSTTTIMLNDTVEPVLAACRGARYLALVGPGGGCLPDPLFARGATVLGGTAIVDREGFVGAMTRGEPWAGFTRKYCIVADRYPGFEALAARVS